MRTLTLKLTKKEWEALRNVVWQALQLASTTKEKDEGQVLMKVLNEMKEVGKQTDYFNQAESYNPKCWGELER